MWKSEFTRLVASCKKAQKIDAYVKGFLEDIWKAGTNRLYGSKSHYWSEPLTKEVKKLQKVKKKLQSQVTGLRRMCMGRKATWMRLIQQSTKAHDNAIRERAKKLNQHYIEKVSWMLDLDKAAKAMQKAECVVCFQEIGGVLSQEESGTGKPMVLKRACLIPCSHANFCTICATREWKSRGRCPLCRTVLTEAPLTLPGILQF